MVCVLSPPFPFPFPSYPFPFPLPLPLPVNVNLNVPLLPHSPGEANTIGSGERVGSRARSGRGVGVGRGKGGGKGRGGGGGRGVGGKGRGLGGRKKEGAIYSAGDDSASAFTTASSSRRMPRLRISTASIYASLLLYLQITARFSASGISSR